MSAAADATMSSASHGSPRFTLRRLLLLTALLSVALSAYAQRDLQAAVVAAGCCGLAAEKLRSVRRGFGHPRVMGPTSWTVTAFQAVFAVSIVAMAICRTHWDSYDREEWLVLLVLALAILPIYLRGRPSIARRPWRVVVEWLAGTCLVVISFVPWFRFVNENHVQLRIQALNNSNYPAPTASPTETMLAWWLMISALFAVTAAGCILGRRQGGPGRVRRTLFAGALMAWSGACCVWYHGRFMARLSPILATFPVDPSNVPWVVMLLLGAAIYGAGRLANVAPGVPRPVRETEHGKWYHVFLALGIGGQMINFGGGPSVWSRFSDPLRLMQDWAEWIPEALKTPRLTYPFRWLSYWCESIVVEPLNALSFAIAIMGLSIAWRRWRVHPRDEVETSPVVTWEPSWKGLALAWLTSLALLTLATASALACGFLFWFVVAPG